MKATVYSKSACPFCIAAKQLLEQKQIPYIEFNVENEGYKRILFEKVPGVKTVPQIFLDEEYIGGLNQLKERLNYGNGESRLLNEHA